MNLNEHKELNTTTLVGSWISPDAWKHIEYSHNPPQYQPPLDHNERPNPIS